MGQLLSRKNALKALAEYTKARNEKVEGEALSPAELLLADGLVGLELYVKKLQSNQNLSGVTMSGRDTIMWKRLKFIGRSLGLYPLSEEHKKFYKVRAEMKLGTGGVVGNGFKYVNGRKQYEYILQHCE